MKWLIIQSDGEHRGQGNWTANWFLRECYGIQNALLECGHTADIWGLRHANFKDTPWFESYDAILVLENYEMSWLPDLSKIKNPYVFQWIIDLHVQNAAAYLPMSEHADYVLHSTRRLMADYEKMAPNAEHVWFPNAVDDRYFRNRHPMKVQDLVFIGGLRPPVEQMQQLAGLVHRYGVTGYDYIQEVAHAKVQFNAPVNYGKNNLLDINYRNFETIALGTCLLTNHDEDLIELGFKHEDNCLMYTSVGEAAALARDIIRTGEWSRLANRGLELAREHTYTKRITEIIEEL